MSDQKRKVQIVPLDDLYEGNAELIREAMSQLQGVRTASNSFSNILWSWVPATDQIERTSTNIRDTFSKYFVSRMGQERVPFTPGAFKLQPEGWQGWTEVDGEGFKDIPIDGAERIQNISRGGEQSPLAHVCFRLRYRRTILPINNDEARVRSMDIIELINELIKQQDPNIPDGVGIHDLIHDLEMNLIPVMPHYDSSVLGKGDRGGIDSNNLRSFLSLDRNRAAYQPHREQMEKFDQAIEFALHWSDMLSRRAPSRDVRRRATDIKRYIRAKAENLPTVSTSTNRKERMSVPVDEIPTIKEPGYLMRGISNLIARGYSLDEKQLRKLVYKLKEDRLISRGDVDEGSRRNIEHHYEQMIQNITNAYKSANNAGRGRNNWFDRFLANQPEDDILLSIGDERPYDNVRFMRLARDGSRLIRKEDFMREHPRDHWSRPAWQEFRAGWGYALINEADFNRFMLSFEPIYGPYMWSRPQWQEFPQKPGYGRITLQRGGLDVSRLSFEIVAEYEKQAARSPEERAAGIKRARSRKPEIKATFYCPKLTTEELQLLAQSITKKSPQAFDALEGHFVVPDTPVYYYANGFDTMRVDPTLVRYVNMVQDLLKQINPALAAQMPEMPRHLTMHAFPSIRQVPMPQEELLPGENLVENIDDGNLGRKHLLRYWQFSDRGEEVGLANIIEKYCMSGLVDRWYDALNRISVGSVRSPDKDVENDVRSIIAAIINGRTNADNVGFAIGKYGTSAFDSTLSPEQQADPELFGDGDLTTNFMDSFVRPSLPSAIKSVNQLLRHLESDEFKQGKYSVHGEQGEPVVQLGNPATGRDLFYKVHLIVSDLQEQLQRDISGNWFLNYALGQSDDPEKSNLQALRDKAGESGFETTIRTLIDEMRQIEKEQDSQYASKVEQARQAGLRKPRKPRRPQKWVQLRAQLAALLERGPELAGSVIESENDPRQAYMSNLDWFNTEAFRSANQALTDIPNEIFSKYTKDLQRMASELVQMYRNGKFGSMAGRENDELSAWDWLTKCLTRLTDVQVGGRSLATLPARYGNRKLISTGAPANVNSRITADGFKAWKQYGYKLSKIMDLISAISVRACAQQRSYSGGAKAYGVGYSTASGKAGGGEVMLGVRYAYRASDYKDYFVSPANREADVTGHLDSYFSTLRRALGKRHIRTGDVLTARTRNFEQGDWLPDTLEYSQQAARRGGFVVVENVEYFVGIATSNKHFHKTLHHSMNFRDSLNYLYTHYADSFDQTQIFIEPFSINLKSLYGHVKKAVAMARDQAATNNAALMSPENQERIQQINPNASSQEDVKIAKETQTPGLEVLYIGSIGGAEFLTDQSVNRNEDVNTFEKDVADENWDVDPTGQRTSGMAQQFTDLGNQQKQVDQDLEPAEGPPSEEEPDAAPTNIMGQPQGVNMPPVAEQPEIQEPAQPTQEVVQPAAEPVPEQTEQPPEEQPKEPPKAMEAPANSFFVTRRSKAQKGRKGKRMVSRASVAIQRLLTAADILDSKCEFGISNKIDELVSEITSDAN